MLLLTAAVRSQRTVASLLAETQGATGDVSGAILKPVSDARKKALDTLCTKWLVQSCRPLSLVKDEGFIDYIDSCSGGRYSPPCIETVQSLVCDLSAVCQATLANEIKALHDDGVMCSVSADIWGENGKSIYGLLVYYIDSKFQLHEKCVAAEPYSEVMHNGENIAHTTKGHLSGVGVGKYEPDNDIDTVGQEVHGSTTDQGSNMVKAFEKFEGAACVNHRLNNSLKCALEVPKIAAVVKKVRTSCLVPDMIAKNHLQCYHNASCVHQVKGIAAHFHRSNKGYSKLQEIQEQLKLRVVKPPVASATRWDPF